jgi:fructosamine-3-kinase
VKDLADRLTAVVGARPKSVRPLSSGHVGALAQADFPDGRTAVVKTDETPYPALDIEARMLRTLREKTALPVPGVWHVEPHLLVMDYVETGGILTPAAEEHAADLLAALHDIRAPRYGFEYDTLIGGLPQPNGWMDEWPAFFADRRLRHMAGLAYEAGQIDSRLRARVDAFAERVSRWLPDPNLPGLIHGDVWGGNVLTRSARIAAFIDPAIYFADPEIELAFITLFGTFGDRFFARYREHRPIPADFFQTRRDVYNLYPLLVHARLFGGGYVGQVEGILRRFGA